MGFIELALGDSTVILSGTALWFGGGTSTFAAGAGSSCLSWKTWCGSAGGCVAGSCSGGVDVSGRAVVGLVPPDDARFGGLHDPSSSYAGSRYVSSLRSYSSPLHVHHIVASFISTMPRCTSRPRKSIITERKQ